MKIYIEQTDRRCCLIHRYRTIIDELDSNLNLKLILKAIKREFGLGAGWFQENKILIGGVHKKELEVWVLENGLT